MRVSLSGEPATVYVTHDMDLFHPYFRRVADLDGFYERVEKEIIGANWSAYKYLYIVADRANRHVVVEPDSATRVEFDVKFIPALYENDELDDRSIRTVRLHDTEDLSELTDNTWV